MMDKQPEALLIADALDALMGEQNLVGAKTIDQASTKLRRLHEVNQELVEVLKFIIKGIPDTWGGVQSALAVIAKAEGESK